MTGCLRRDAGSATVWVLGACVVVCLVGLVATVRAQAVLARHRAEAAADLAALAAAGRIGVDDTPCAWALRIASSDGAQLISCQVSLAPDGRSGTVDVAVAVTAEMVGVGQRVARASARAGREPPASEPTSVAPGEGQDAGGDEGS